MPEPSEPVVYVVTDIECDGPRPGDHSMLSFASVAVTAEGADHGSFEAVLEPLPGAAGDPETLAWFATQPDAWAAATADPRPADRVMTEYADWVRSLPRPRVFTAHPLAFDGTWIDHYLRRYTTYGLVQGPYEPDRLFDGTGLCLRSYAAAVTGRPVTAVVAADYPPVWLGEVEHNHRAIDDARGYAHLLRALVQRVSVA